MVSYLAHSYAVFAACSDATVASFSRECQRCRAISHVRSSYRSSEKPPTRIVHKKLERVISTMDLGKALQLCCKWCRQDSLIHLNFVFFRCVRRSMLRMHCCMLVCWSWIHFVLFSRRLCRFAIGVLYRCTCCVVFDGLDDVHCLLLQLTLFFAVSSYIDNDTTAITQYQQQQAQDFAT